MTTPEPDAQEFMESVAGSLEDRGYSAMATFLRSEMPDSDVTSMGGQGTEQIAGAIVESFIRERWDSIVETTRGMLGSD